MQGTAGGTRGAETRGKVVAGVPPWEGAPCCPCTEGDGAGWSGRPALFLASRWGRAGALKALADLAALPFSWPFLGSMPWLLVSPGPVADLSCHWSCRVWHLPASPSLHPQGTPVHAPGRVPNLLCWLVWVGGPPQPGPRWQRSPCWGGHPVAAALGEWAAPCLRRAERIGLAARQRDARLASQSRRFLVVVLFISSCKCAPCFGE